MQNHMIIAMGPWADFFDGVKVDDKGSANACEASLAQLGGQGAKGGAQEVAFICEMKLDVVVGSGDPMNIGCFDEDDMAAGMNAESF